MRLPQGLETAIKVGPDASSTLVQPYLEAIHLLLDDGVSEDLLEACMARCLIEHKDPVPFAWHYLNVRAKARGEGLRFSEGGTVMPGPRGGRRASDQERGDARGLLALNQQTGGRPPAAPQPPPPTTTAWGTT